MRVKEKQNVTARVGSIIVSGIVVKHPEMSGLALACLDADILIPLHCCYEIKKCSRKELTTRTEEQKIRAKRIVDNLIKTKKVYRR